MSAVLFTEVKFLSRAHRPRAVMRAAGDRCACCCSVDLPQYSSGTPDEAQSEMLSPLSS